VPKIDWFDNFDDQPHWEPRIRRDRVRRDPHDRRSRLEQLIAMTQPPSVTQEPSARRPLHLIWGAPVRQPAPDAPDASG